MCGFTWHFKVRTAQLSYLSYFLIPVEENHTSVNSSNGSVKSKILTVTSLCHLRLSTIKLHEIKNACKTSLPYVNDWKRAYDPDVMVCVFLLFSSQTLHAPMNANMSIQLNPKIRDWDVIAFWLLSTNLIMIRNSMTYTTITVHLSIFNKWKVKNTFNPPWK